MSPDRVVGRNPLSADHLIPSIVQTFFDPTNPSQMRVDVLAVGPTRNYRLGESSAGIQPRQPRQGAILFQRDENLPRSIRAIAYHPRIHPEVPVSVTYQQARTLIPPEEVLRTLETALH